jgi:hypothetical protein
MTRRSGASVARTRPQTMDYPAVKGSRMDHRFLVDEIVYVSPAR